MSATPSPAEPPPRARPQSLADLFSSFSVLALQGFGGVIAVAQRELVERKGWLTREEFVEDWAVAQVLPGPNVVNLSIIIGERYFGWRGAVFAMAGMLVFPLMVVLAVAALFATVAGEPVAQGALRGMGAVAAGLITATSIKLISGLKGNVVGPAVCTAVMVLTFVAVALLRLPLYLVVLVLGGAASIWAYRQIGRVQRAGAPT